VLLRPGRTRTILGAHAAVRTQAGRRRGQSFAAGKQAMPASVGSSIGAVVLAMQEYERNALNVVFSDALPSSAQARTCGWARL
jgi:hypothetical protein